MHMTPDLPNGPRASRTRRRWPLARTLLSTIALLLATGFTATASRAAFAASSIVTIEVASSERDGRPPLFELGALTPGDSATNCTVVDNLTPGGPGILRMYSGGFEESGSLSDHLEITVEEGTGGSHGDCTGFIASATIYSGTLSEFDATHTDYATSAGACTRSDAHSMAYRITITLDRDTPNQQQGAWVRDLAITWESRPPN